MNVRNVDLMRSARESLSGRWGQAIGVTLVYFLITAAVQGLSNISPIFMLGLLALSGPLGLGISIYFLNVSRGRVAQFEQMFEGFKYFINAMATYILMVIFIFLWMLLLIIPGIIAALSYSMTFYILAEEPTTDPMVALRKSKEMMNGYKMKLLGMSMMFLGLGILCILTLGIGFLWLMPYMYVSYAKFYDDIKHPQIEYKG